MAPTTPLISSRNHRNIPFIPTLNLDNPILQHHPKILHTNNLIKQPLLTIHHLIQPILNLAKPTLHIELFHRIHELHECGDVLLELFEGFLVRVSFLEEALVPVCGVEGVACFKGLEALF
jgi:hypothetical protein